MTTTLDDAFVIPQAEDLSALDFVIRIDAAAQQNAVKRLIDDYVVTPAVETALPRLFRQLGTAYQRGEAYGHILHGGFGSGKSHLMTILSLLLENQPDAWAKDHAAFERLRQEHRAWVQEANLLVVRVHMLSARRAGAGLDDVLYESVNKALQAKGRAPLLVSGAQEVLAEIRREASAYGQAFWDRAAAAGVAEGPHDLQMAEEAGEEAVQALAEAYLKMNGRSFQAEGLKPAWGEGLQRIARHAKDHGFGGVMLLIDEFLLWLAEKAGEDFVTAINDMNTIVDFSGRRAAPIFVVFARQRNIRDFFPDLTDQDRIQQRVDHHAKRFEVTQLQDVELRYIVKGRVLREQKAPQAIQQAVEALQTTYRSALDELLGGQGAEVLADVYPFHPALIDVLVDVSNLMQRERSALRLLYELLAHNRSLPLGELLPVGRAFDHVFPPGGVEAAQKTELLQKIHAEWYQRLIPRIDHFVEQNAEDGVPISEERATALRQILKTVLLGLVSPRLTGKGNERMTIARLVKLNYSDADGSRLKNKVGRVWSDLRRFQVQFPELQLAGEKGDAVVSYALGQGSIREVLRRAEEKVNNDTARLATLGRRLNTLLPKPLRDLVKTKEGIAFDLSWRGTDRRGRLLFENVRTQPHAAFEPGAGERFRVLMDYPWDDPGHTVGEDVERVAAVRRARGTMTTAAWLPRHFSNQEMRLLRELAAAEWVVDSGPNGELLATYGTDERTLLLEQAQKRVEALSRQVDEALVEAYSHHGQAKALVGHRDPDLGTGTVHDDLTQLIRELLDRRYPQHPEYKAKASRTQIVKVEQWLREAWADVGSVHFDADAGAALEDIAKPLELVSVGQSRATIEHNGRFVKMVVGELGDHKTVAWPPIAERLREAPVGLTDDVVDLLLVYTCLLGYRLQDAQGNAVQPRIGMGSGALTLVKADLLDLPSWSRVRGLAQQVLNVQSTDAHRNLSGQDRLAERVSEAATEARDRLMRLHARLADLDAGDSDRQHEVKSLLEKLAPLVKRDSDSFQKLTEWLSVWPEQDASLRTAVRALSTNLAALDALDTTSRAHLLRARTGRLAGRIEAALAALDDRLQSREHVRPLRSAEIERFNTDAAQIVSELVAVPAEPPPGPPQPPPKADEREEAVHLELPLAENLDDLVQTLKALQAQGALLSVEVRWRRREESR